MRCGNSLWKNLAATEDSSWFTLLSSSPLPAEGQTSPRSSIKLIRCNFFRQKTLWRCLQRWMKQSEFQIRTTQTETQLCFSLSSIKGDGEGGSQPAPERQVRDLAGLLLSLREPSAPGMVEYTLPHGREAKGWMAALEKEQPAAWNRYIFCFSNATFRQMIRST